MLSAQDWSFPIPIAYGPGRIGEIGSFCRAHGMARPLVVTDRGSAGLPFIGELRAQLGTAVYSEISPNPRDEEILAGRAVFRAGGHDGIVAIGGGSGMDGGKAISLLARNELAIWDFEYERASPELPGERPFPPLICVPTTAGTGAETESTAMVTDTSRMMKWCVWHPKQKPVLAVLDPELTVGLPPHLTAWTGVDAMVHAIEAYCVPGFHPLCDGMALQGLRLIARWLPVAVEEPSNLEARGAMLTGSCLAGIAFLKGLGVVHAISHMVGAEFDTQHGLTNAVLLPACLRHNAPAIADKVTPMAQAMGIEKTGFDGLYDGVCAILDRLAIPRDLSEIGVPPGAEARLAAKALQDSAAGTNASPLTAQDIEAIIRTAMNGAR